MDSGRGNFEMADNEEQLKHLMDKFPLHGGTFRIGQEVELKGSHFKVSRITPKKITLRLLSKVRREETQEEKLHEIENKLNALERIKE